MKVGLWVALRGTQSVDLTADLWEALTAALKVGSTVYGKAGAMAVLLEFSTAVLRVAV